MASCCASAGRIRSGCCSHNRVLPSMSVKRKVTTRAEEGMSLSALALFLGRYGQERDRPHILLSTVENLAPRQKASPRAAGWPGPSPCLALKQPLLRQRGVAGDALGVRR